MKNIDIYTLNQISNWLTNDSTLGQETLSYLHKELFCNLSGTRLGSNHIDIALQVAVKSSLDGL